MKRLFTGTLIIAAISICWINALAQSESRETILREIEAKHGELQQLEKKLLLPSAEDLETYAEFLRQPDTGLTRLLPRETYDSSDYPQKRMTMGGTNFSFTRRSHEYGRGTQIGFEQGQLNSSFAGADYGILVNLGEIPLETLSSEHPALRFLGLYEAANKEPLARSEYYRFATGVVVDDASYRTRQKARVNNTYALRGIHYDDSDVLVVFRIVRQDIDNSIIIAWKLLKKYPKPELARNN